MNIMTNISEIGVIMNYNTGDSKSEAAKKLTASQASSNEATKFTISFSVWLADKASTLRNGDYSDNEFTNEGRKIYHGTFKSFDSQENAGGQDEDGHGIRGLSRHLISYITGFVFVSD
jgi:fructose-bisphosphate aldolase class 1